MAELPRGTVTFLFTDIAASTALWERHEQAMPSVLARHNTLIRQAIEAHGGAVFKIVGDAVHAAFARARDALVAALAAQRAIMAEPWDALAAPAAPQPAGQPPAIELRVRMAMHSGTAEPHDGDYLGPPLNRAARLLAAGHSGQILLSLAAAELVGDTLPLGVALLSLGEHRLKDLARAEQIFQLQAPDLPATFPPLHTLDTPTAGQPALPLLATKLYIPAHRPGLVLRPRLVERLNAGLNGKLTLVAAPAGFGKTTLVSEWIGQNDERGTTNDEASAHHSSLVARRFKAAWVSLDAGDNDATRFWSYVVTALDMVFPGVGAAALALLRLPQPPPIETILTPLLNTLSQMLVDIALVLDDYHLIDAQAIHRSLAFLLDHLPARLHVVIITRADPPLPLNRLRARGDLAELRAAEVRFTPEEAAAFLTEVMRLPLSAADVAALDARTEGWIAGLQFAALAMRDRADLAGFVDAFTGSNRFVVDYLAEEVVNRQPRHLQTFLLQTAILDRMCGPLCDAILGLEARDLGLEQGAPSPKPQAPSPSSYSQLILEQLERANVFLMPLDDQRGWYRYHHLFADVLRGRLRSGASRETVEALHQRASIWFDRHGLVAEAVGHALAAHDWEWAAAWIEQSGPALALGGQVLTVLGWLNALPDALVRSRASLCIIHGLALLFADHLDAAEARMRDAERCVQPDTPPDQAHLILGRVATIRANLARYYGDIGRAIELAHQALDLLPETDLLARAPAMVGISRVYFITGDVTPPAERLAAAAIEPARASGNLLAFLASVTNLARLQALQGRLRQAAQTYEEAARSAPSHASLRVLEGSPAYYFGMGDLLRERNDLDAAERYLTQGMELSAGPFSVDADVISLGYIAQARLWQARGQHHRAGETLDTLLEVSRRRRFVAALAKQGTAAQARLWLAQQRLAAARHWAETSGLTPDDEPSYAREAEHLTLARVLIEQGRREPAGPSLHDALRLLGRLLLAAEACARASSAIEILYLQALARQAQGDTSGALGALGRALALAEPEGYARIFLDEGEPGAALLREAAARGISSGYVASLLEAFPTDEKVTGWQGDKGKIAHGQTITLAPPHPVTSSLLEPLTDRELEVLRLVAAGHSNREIADQLVLALGTVKRHINNIFGKLGVQSRTQALVQARDLNLI